MIHGDPEPPTLPHPSTLRVAKNEYLERKYWDKDAIISISRMKRADHTDQKLAIRHVGYDPFYVFYFTNYQKLVYKQYAMSEVPSLKIDASGGFVQRIVKADGTLGQTHIFISWCNTFPARAVCH